MPLLKQTNSTRKYRAYASLAGALLCLVPGLCRADTPQIANCDGYPCVNFSLGANVSTNGEVFGSLFFNPPQLGAGLNPLGGGRFSFSAGGESISAKDCATREVKRGWPLAAVRLGDPRLNGVAVGFRVAVPNAFDDVFIGSLPVALAELSLTNSTDTQRELTINFDGSRFLKEPPKPLSSEWVSGGQAGKDFVAWVRAGATLSTITGLTSTVSLPARSGATLRFLLGHWEDNWPCSARLSNPQQLADFAARHWETLFSATERLSARMSSTGDAALNDSLRWYATAGVSLTRALKDGTVLTMGYHELNQRDSYWTTWIHLKLWPSLEKRMIREAVWGQRPDGKVPTTILPLIERGDDTDINCYFILRGLRYVKFHRDEEFGRMILPSLLKAADWLASRDREGSGLPQAGSFWFDWKDVSGVNGRKYSPYAAMLYVAAMQRLAEFCDQVGEKPAAVALRERAGKGLALLNRPVKEGGLWNGRYYQQVWRDGHDVPQVLQDQVVGILFDVVDKTRARSVLSALEPSLTPWGVRETFPYHPDGFGYKGGDYHNGGIWPWLNHAHAWALFKIGAQAEGKEILKRIAHGDLEMAGDYIPNEYLNGETGKQCGVPMQGWNAAMFGAVAFGLDGSGQVP